MADIYKEILNTFKLQDHTEATTQAIKLNNLQSKKEEKLQRLGGESPYEPLSRSHTVMEDGTLESNSNKIWNEYTPIERQFLLGHAIANYSSDVQDSGETRLTYLYPTKDGGSKLGLSTGGAETSDVRYDNTIDPKYTDAWRRSGETGPDIENKLLDVRLAFPAATVLEAIEHGNAGNLADRKYKDILSPEALLHEGGVSEYYNKKASDFYGDASNETLTPERQNELISDFNKYIRLPQAQSKATKGFAGAPETITYKDYMQFEKEKGDSNFLDSFEADGIRIAALAAQYGAVPALKLFGNEEKAKEIEGRAAYDLENADYLAGHDPDDMNFLTKIQRAIRSGGAVLANKLVSGAGYGVETVGNALEGLAGLDKDFISKENKRLAKRGESVGSETRTAIADDVIEAGTWLQKVGKGIQDSTVKFDKENKANKITGFNSKDIEELSKEVDDTIKNEGYISAATKAITDVRSFQVLAQSVPEMVALAVSVGGMSLVNVNHNLNIAEENANRELTTTEKVKSASVSIISTYLDRAGDKLALSGMNGPKMALKAAVEKAPTVIQNELVKKFGKGILSIGEAPLRILGAGLAEGVTEKLQTLGETAAQNVEVFEKGYTQEQTDESNVAGVLGFASGGHMATPAAVASVAEALSPMVGTSKDKIQEVLNRDGKSKEDVDVDVVNAEDVKFGDTKITDDEADNLRTTYRLAKEGASVLDLADLANTATELEDYLASNNLVDTEEYAEIDKSRKETYAKIIDEAKLVSTVEPDATEAEKDAADEAFYEVIQKYGLSEKAKNKLMTEFLNSVYGTLDYANMPDLDYAEVPDTASYADIPTESYADIPTEGETDLPSRPAKRAEPVGLDLDEDTEYAAVPESDFPTRPLNKDAKEAVKENIESKKKSNKITVEKKVDPTDEDLGVGAVTEDGYTKGVSARTINRLGKMFGLPSEKVRDALEISMPFMKVRQMKYVSKEANDVQRETYYGKDGINPAYIEYKKAIQEGDSEKALIAIDKIRNRAIKLEEKVARHEDVVRDIKNVANAVLKRFEEGKIDADKAADYLLLNTKSVGGKYQVSALDVLYDELPKEIQDKVEKPEVNNGIEIANSQRETITFIDSLLAAEGIEREKVQFAEVKVADRVAEYEAKVEKLKESIAEQEAVVNATEDKFDKVNEANLLKKLENDLAKAEEILNNYKTKYPDKDFIYRRVYTKDEQIEKETKAKIASELGKEVGTLTEAEVEEAKARGVDVKEDMVKEIQKVSDVKDIPAKVEKLKELKKKVDTVAEEYKDKEEALRKKLAVDKKLASELREVDEKAYIELKKKLDALYGELDKFKNSKKQVKKELKASEKAEEELAERLADTSESVDSVYKDVRDVDKNAHKYSLDYREGKKSLKDLNTLAKDVLSRLKSLGKSVKLAVLDVRKVLKNRKVEELRAELNSIDNNIANTEESIRNVIRDAQGVFNNKALVSKVATGFKRRKKLEGLIYRIDNDKSGLAKEKSAKIKRVWDEIRKTEKELFGTRLIDNALSTGPSGDVESVSQKNKEAKPNINDKVETVPTLFGQVDMADLAELIEDKEAKRVYLDIVNNAVSVLSKIIPEPTGNDTILAGDVLANPASAILWDKVDGKYVMNKQVAAVIALTASEYIGTNGIGLIRNSKADIARILDKMHEWQVTKAEYDMLRVGKLMVNESTSVGSQVLGSLGIKKDSTTMPIGQYAQLASSIGMHALLYAEAKGYIEDTSSAKSSISAAEWNATYDADTKSKRKNKKIDSNAKVLKVVGKESKKKVYENLKENMKLINEALNIEDASRDYRISPINTKDKVYKIRNGYGVVPERTQEVLRTIEDQKWRVAEDAMEEFDALVSTSDAKLRELMGWKDTDAMKDEGIYLLDAIAEQESRNTEIENSIESLKALRARKNAIPKDLYFAWFFSKNGRYMLDSTGVNPQTDKKLSRALLVPKEATEVTWDLTDEKDKLYFMSGILQGLGIELDNHTTDYIVKLGEDLLKKVDSSDVIDNIRDSLLLGDGKFEFGDTVFNSGHPGHTMQAIAALKKYKNRGDSKGVKAVVTMEFDAKTSGFAFKLLQLPFDTTAEQAKWLEKTGIYIGDKLNSIDGKGSNDALTKIEDAYRTLGREADTLVKEITEDPNSVKNDKFGVWPALSITKGAVESMVDDVTDAVTAFARELFKYPFMRFNYAESIESNKKSLAYDLTNKTLGKIADGSLTLENSPELFAALGVKDAALLREHLVTKELKNIRVIPVKGSKGYEVPIEEVLQNVFEASYGEVLEKVMGTTFAHMLEANNVMIAATQIMADGFIAELSKIKDRTMTEAQLIDHIKELEKVFPIIKSPFGKNRSEGVTLISSGRQPNKDWEAVTKVKGKETKTITVQSIIREFERAQAAGAVIPTHWTDGAVIGEALMLGGILGIHDAIMLGLGGKRTEEAVHTMNKATLDISMQYNIMQNMLDALTESLNNMSDEAIMAIEPAKDMESPMEVLSTLTDLTNKNNKLRANLFEDKIASGNVVGYAGGVYYSEGTKDKKGILTDSDLLMLELSEVDADDDLVSKVEEMVKGCTNG